MSLFNELKRRNVIRVGIAYAITAWLIAQIAGLAAVSFFAPDWVMKMIITMLILGSPVALVMAWAYELTPDGLRRETDIEAGQSTAHTTASKLDRTITIVLVLALVYFGYDKFVLGPQRDAALLESAARQTGKITEDPEQAEKQPEAGHQSIAVLSFVNMSDDAGNDYFSEGLSEELLNLLAKIPELRVAARTSSFSYKDTGTKIAQIGEELNVTHVLEGSVRKSGNQLRITAQLIKANDGFHLWSETYDRTLDNIFQIQEEIAAAVVAGLKVTLLGALPEPRKTDPEVYSLYLQGKYFNNLKGEENWKKAISAFSQALAIDPNYAPAWVSLSRTYRYQVNSRLRARDEGFALALEAVEKALAIDRDLATAWANLGLLRMYFEWDWAGGKTAIDKALQLEPNNAAVLDAAASLAATLGQKSTALELYEQSLSLDPLNLSSLNALGLNYMKSGFLDKAIDTYEQLVTLSPGYPWGYSNLARVYLLKGNAEQALLEVNKNPSGPLYSFEKAQIYFTLGNETQAQAYMDEFLEESSEDFPGISAAMYAWRGDIDSAFELLERAYQQRDGTLTYLLVSAYYINLESDPRYPVFLEKLGLLEAWKAMPKSGE